MEPAAARPTNGLLRALNPLVLARNLYARRDLIWQFTNREIQLRYRGTLLGFGWAMLQPLIMLGVYSIVFGLIFTPKVTFDSPHFRVEFTLFLFCGLTVFNIFSECVGRSTACVLANPNFVKKVVFPLEILPISILGAALVPAGINLLLILIGSAYVHSGLSWMQLLMPVVLVPLIFFTLGVSWFLAALGVFFRDVGQIIGLVLQALSFLSAIFYSLDGPESWRRYLYFNPLAVLVESLRAAMLWRYPMPYFALGMTTLFSFVFMLLGYAFFFKCKRAFADVI
jgi:lipopolysaccharide transport system permease protein